jgi:replicative DNA helicase
MDKYQQQFENECTVLGCFIKEPSLLNETKLQPSHYYNYNNKMVFIKLLKMNENNEPINLISLMQTNENDLFIMGGKSHIKEIHDSAISIHSFKHYETLVMQFTAVEESFQILEDYKQQTKDIHRISDLSNVIDKLQQIDVSIGSKEKTTQEKLQERVNYHVNTPGEGLSGTNTGFVGMNEATDGWQPGDLIVIGARPSMGKTAVTLNMNNNGIKNDPNVIGSYITAEMAVDGIIDREIALEAGIPVNMMRNPNKYFNDKNKYWDKYRQGVRQIELIRDRLNIWREHDVTEIRSKIRRLVSEQPNKKHVIYIDHLSHLKIKGNYYSRTQEVGAICQSLKDTAVDYKVSIVLLCQLNRSVEGQQDKRPNMSHLRDSGEIEQIADVIIFIYREDYYSRNDPNYTPTHITELLIDKNRQGDIGMVKLKFEPSSNRFYDI